MKIILSELLTTEYVISTPFTAYLGRVPIQVYAVLDNTVVYQIIGSDDRKVTRHDFVTVDPETLWARPTPLLDQLHKSRIKGRMNSHGQNEENGTTAENSFEVLYEDTEQDSNFESRPEHDPLERLAFNATDDSL